MFGRAERIVCHLFLYMPYQINVILPCKLETVPYGSVELCCEGCASIHQGTHNKPDFLGERVALVYDRWRSAIRQFNLIGSSHIQTADYNICQLILQGVFDLHLKVFFEIDVARVESLIRENSIPFPILGVGFRPMVFPISLNRLHQL